MIYTGIGSRLAPQSVLKQCKSFGAMMARHGHTLRSGGADGCDTEFELGCDSEQGNKEIYIPWKGFNKNSEQRSGLELSDKFNISTRAMEIAEEFHPNWKSLSQGAKKMMGRNTNQIFGDSTDLPRTDFVICWTVEGRDTGGTSQALRIARHYKIPIFNFGSMSAKEILNKYKEMNND